MVSTPPEVVRRSPSRLVLLPVRMDTRRATTEDSVVEVSESDDAGRFLDPTGLMRARVSHWDPGIPIAGWSGQIDQAVWFVAGF